LKAAYQKGGTAMKSMVRNFALSLAAAAKRRMVAIDPTGTQRTFRFKKGHLLLAVGLLAPLQSFAATEAPYCIAVNGGWPNGGATFVARNFTLPAACKCTAWTGYTKTAGDVVLTTSGTSCMSSDSKQLTTSVTSQDPWFVPITNPAFDYIQLNRSDANDPLSGTDYGYFGGTAEPVSCNSDLLNLPSSHN
jgi:hypothetical protein